MIRVRIYTQKPLKGNCPHLQGHQAHTCPQHQVTKHQAQTLILAGIFPQKKPRQKKEKGHT